MPPMIALLRTRPGSEDLGAQSNLRMKRVWPLIFLTCLMAVLWPGSQAWSSRPEGEQAEWWPEIDTYVGLNQRMRLMFQASRTRDRESYSSAEIGLTLEITLKPIFKRRFETNNNASGSRSVFNESNPCVNVGEAEQRCCYCCNQ